MPITMDNDAMDIDQPVKDQPKAAASSADKYDFDSLLRCYYRMDTSSKFVFFNPMSERLFPAKEMYQWLAYGNVDKTYFLHREFSFTLKDDIYVRYKCFPDAESFSRELKKECPYKIDIGAVYSLPPQNRTTVQDKAKFYPKEKELVFDIDMTDYNDVRSCCTADGICSKCWVLMVAAIRIMDTALREDFGFNNLLWVYSGRRGIHCWVCDSSARCLSGEARKAVAEYLTVIAVWLLSSVSYGQGGEGKTRQVKITDKLHASLRRAYEQVLLPLFEEHILSEQKLLDTEESQKKLLSVIPDEVFRQSVLEAWANEGDPLTKWDSLKKTVAEAIKKKRFVDINSIYDIVFTYSYPRLDVNVSTGVNHLLKAPFCIHPKTGTHVKNSFSRSGRVCVPIDPNKCAEFDPSSVPTVTELVNALDNYETSSHNGEKGNQASIAIDNAALKDYKKTEMGRYVRLFKQGFLRPLQESIKKEQMLIAAKNNTNENKSFDF